MTNGNLVYVKQLYDGNMASLTISIPLEPKWLQNFIQVLYGHYYIKMKTYSSTAKAKENIQ